MDLSYRRFADVDIADPFFDSLKADYQEFSDWFQRKAEYQCYVSYDDNGLIDGFLFLKPEDGSVTDVTPPLPPLSRIKVGTFKINPRGTRLGERFVKKAFDHALTLGAEEIYVTVFEKHGALIDLFLRYGFELRAVKNTKNGTEKVLVKQVLQKQESVVKSYPLVDIAQGSSYLLGIHPKWHTRLLPDSILKWEDTSVIQDVSHTNSIHKVYLAGMRGMENVRTGDALLIYRTSDNKGYAKYRSVATSVCAVEEYRDIRSFLSEDEFLRYCRPYSVFDDFELRGFWMTKKYCHIIRFTYNFALQKRITRGQLLEDFGFDSDAYPGFMPISNRQLMDVARAGGLRENFIVD